MARNDIFLHIPRGFENRITASELEDITGVTPRETRLMVSGARSVGIPIGSDSHGYFYAINPNELETTIKTLVGYRNAIDDVLAGLSKPRFDFKIEELKEIGKAETKRALDTTGDCG